jgi:drug/metabolite transporter (DMT)-like permease
MKRGAARGYLLVAGSFLIMGMIGALVEWATAPESALLVIRFATAGIVLGALLARRHPLAGVRQRSVWPRLLLMGFVDAFTLLLFFVAIRGTSVAIGMFLQFLAPVWVALLAPRVFRVATERIVYPALAVALVGLAVILAPALLGEGLKVSAGGVAAGLAAGVGYAVFQLVVKDLTRRVSAVTIVFTEAWLDAAVLLPLALWQTIGAGYHLTSRDLIAGVILGVVCTALAYTMWTAGMGLIKVQHSSILGYLEPVSAPLYAFLLLGQGISVWTVTGGTLIVIAGLLVVLLGEPEEEAVRSLEPAP